mmetsp:Transcript_17450/g.28652  ORF Transcript_17450/g.28652 Transcript_17450/m.28652 type:complete len:124 (+) Transcript_17450:168-539(+)
MAAFVAGASFVPPSRSAVATSSSSVCKVSSRRQISFAASPVMGDNNIAFFGRKFEAAPAASTSLPASAMTITALNSEPPKEEGTGFTFSAETFNGRAAMIGFFSALLVEYVTGQGTLHFLGLL